MAPFNFDIYGLKSSIGIGKIGAKNVFPYFLAIFALVRLQKDLIFGIFILDLVPKLLLDVFNIHFIYFE